MSTNKCKSILLFFLLLVCTVALINCAAKRDEDAPYSSGYDNASLVTITQSEGYPDIRFPVNQLVVYTEDNMTRTEFLDLLRGRRDVQVIGQLPSVGLYQLEVEAETVEELDTIKEDLTAIEGISGAAYNILRSDLAEIGSCPVQPDIGLSDVSEYDKLPYYQINYYTALEIMQGLREKLTLNQVTVGIVELGYDQNVEFDDIVIENVSERADNGTRRELSTDTVLNSHGTSVAGIICADNDGIDVNGLANTLIGNKLRVVMANSGFEDPLWMGDCIAMAMTVIDGGADVVNSSFGYGPFDNATSELARDIIAGFTHVMNRFPDVLFVNAAPNQNVELTGNNHAPAGIRLSNSLTVSRWYHEHPGRRMEHAGYGDPVDISAPGDNLKTVFPHGLVTSRSGTSFAAPMVTSAAALLKAIGGPGLSPAEIKNLLLDPSFHGERCEPGGGIQLNFAFPLVDLLWQEYQGEQWAEQYLAGESGEQHTIPEIVSSRLCESTWLTVDYYGTFELADDGDCPSGLSMILDPQGTQWSIFASHLSNDANDLAELTVAGTPAVFALDTNYDLSQDTLSVAIIDDDMINEECESVDAQDGDFFFRGTSNGGSYRFTRCTITERTSDGKPKYLRVDVDFSGTMVGYVTTYYPSDPVLPIVTDELGTSFSGLIKDVRVATLDPFGTFSQAVEEACLRQNTDF